MTDAPRKKHTSCEPWTTDEIGLVRRLNRQGKSVAEIRDALNSPLSLDTIQQRARKQYGIPLSRAQRAHLGNSKVSLPPDRATKRARAQAERERS